MAISVRLFLDFSHIIIFLSFLSGFSFKTRSPYIFVGHAHTELGAPVVKTEVFEYDGIRDS